ncbi:MAG: SpaH/EbpB family LPXTG-anchored major pilin [Agathobacter rectalis]
MKKFKKMLAGLLGAAMVLTSFGTPAWAESKVDTPQKTTATIDTKKTGSITIHKYEYNGDTAQLPDGTGEKSDLNNVPTGPADAEKATPLKGAGFTIYKVMDDTEMLAYYNGKTNEKDVTVDKYVDGGSIKETYISKVFGKEQRTDEKGETKFSGLPLGIYVVIETTKPDSVKTPVVPFLVSIPMTTSSTKTEWLYDVNVYPKNGTQYGSINLEKQGNDATTKLSGVKFCLQKEQTGGSWIDCKDLDEYSAKKDDFAKLTTGENGTIKVAGLSKGHYRFIETDRGKNSGYIMDGLTAYDFDIDVDGNAIAHVGSTTKVTDGTITVKNEKPDMKKEVEKRPTTAGGKAKWGHVADYSVGDAVPYKITVNVPSNITKLKEFTLTDTPNNLHDNTDTIKMYDLSDPDKTDIVKDGEEITKIWSVAQDKGADGFKITFSPENMTSYAGHTLVIEYNATLKATAVKTIAGNPNTATLEYTNVILPDKVDNNNPNKPKDNPGKDKIEDSTAVYTFDFKIHKTDSNNYALNGAEFDLYKSVDADTEGALTTEQAKALGLPANKTWKKVNDDPLVTSGEGNLKGEVTQSGLRNDEYYLIETKAPQDYNLLKAPVAIKLNILYTTTWEENKEWDNNTDGTTILKKHDISTKTTTFTQGENSTGTVVEVNKDNDINGTMTETIINRKGFELPKTGDIGTAMFLIIGIGGMLAAVYIMLRGRKRA